MPRTLRWRDTVYRFAQLLDHLGVDADVDLYYQHEAVVWSKLCQQRIEDADRIAVAVRAVDLATGELRQVRSELPERAPVTRPVEPVPPVPHGTPSRTSWPCRITSSC